MQSPTEDTQRMHADGANY